MGKKKITELPQATSPDNSVTKIVKGGQSQQLRMEVLKDWIKKEITTGLVNTVVPNVEIAIEGSTINYKINNISQEMLQEIGDDVRIALVRYKRYNRIREDENSGVKKYDTGRKWTLVDDSTSKYEQKQVGENVANLENRIFWTNVKIKPEKLKTSSYFNFVPFGFTADNITSRYMYFVTDNKTENMRLSSLNIASTMSPEGAQEMFRVTGKNNKVDFDSMGRIFYSLNLGLVAYRDVKIDGVTKRIFGNIVPFRVCLAWRHINNNAIEYYSVFKKFKK